MHVFHNNYLLDLGKVLFHPYKQHQHKTHDFQALNSTANATLSLPECHCKSIFGLSWVMYLRPPYNELLDF